MEHHSKKSSGGYELSVEHVDSITRVNTIDVDNYHGLSLQIVLSLNCLVFAQIVSLVGSGAYARDIAATVGGATKIIWLAQTIAILTCALGPPVSQASDYWGRKWFMVGAAGFGCIGSVIMSRGTSIGMVLVGSVISALNYGASPLAYAVASEILPRRHRTAAQAGLNLSGGLGGVFGLLVGEVFVTNYHEGWRMYFYVLAAFFGLSGILFALLYNPPPRPMQLSLTPGEKLGRLDWVGFALLIFGITLLTIGLSWGENPYSWKNVHTLTPLLIGFIILIGLVVHQWLVKSDGMFHHALFQKDRNFSCALIAIFLEGVAFFATNGFFTFEMSVLYETNPILVGLRFSILFITAAASSIAVGVWSSKYKAIREPIIAAFGFYTFFYVLMATATLNSSKAMWAYPVFIGIGFGLCLSPVVAAAQLSGAAELIAIKTGLVIGVRSLGGSIGLAICTAIFNSQISKRLGPDIASAVLALGLSPQVLPDFIAALASDNHKALLAIPGVTPQIIDAGVHALQGSYLKSFRYIWVAAGVLSVAGMITSLFFINPKKDLTMHVDAPLENENE